MNMAAKKQTFIDVELQWAEDQLATWKQYIDDHPIEDLKHEVVGKTVVTIQVQGKFIQETMKNYLNLLAQVDAMRKDEETKKISVRGNQELTPMERGEI
jgi:hypothetical protein